VGHRVRTLVDGPRNAGVHHETWDGTNAAGAPVASGVYYCRFRAHGVTMTKKMVLVR